MAMAEQALAIDSVLPEAYAALADAYGSARDFGRAIPGYQDAVRRDRDNGIAWCHLAWACNATGDPKAAESAAREAIRLYPTYGFAYQQLATALRDQGRDEEAVAAYEDRIEWDPGALSPFFDIAEVHWENGDYRAALETYERAAERQETPTVVRYIARGQAAVGDADSALASLEAALDAGYRGFTSIEEDESFSELRATGRLEPLLARYR